MDRHDTLTQLDAIVEATTLAPLKRELQAVAHKFRYPMADTLAKVPGETLTERARKIGVSRQTMYVWAAERFRPTVTQAKRISKLTSVPVAQIVDNGFEENYDARRKAHKKTARVASRSKKPPRGDGGSTRGRGRVVSPQARTRSARKVHG